MDLRKIRYFVAVAEEQNMGRAAARLHISQPPLTRQIQQIEIELGVLLFERTSRGVELTQAGEFFLREARNICSIVEQSVERTKRAGQGKLGRLDVAIFGSGVLDIIPKLLLLFRQRYPEVKVVLHTMTKEEQIQALRQRRITVGFNRLLSPMADISSELVTTERLLLAINTANPLATSESVPFRALAEHPLVLFPSVGRPNFVDKVLGLCREAGFEPEISQEIGDAVTGVALVASGFGVCLVPESATTLKMPGVVYRHFSDAPPTAIVDQSCIFRSDDNSPILNVFLETLRDFREQIADSE